MAFYARRSIDMKSLWKDFLASNLFQMFVSGRKRSSDSRESSDISAKKETKNGEWLLVGGSSRLEQSPG